ncbi:MAG: cobalamin-binding protein [Chromatiales bacterium]|nr:cobalamin-binding protein [Chromatiales bacterium]
MADLSRIAATALLFLLAGCAPAGREASEGVALRIVTLAPHLAELAFAAGAGSRVVGVVEFSDYPAEVAELPRVGDAFRIDFEALAALSPDLVLAWPSGNSSELVSHLRHLGYRVAALEPEGLDSIPAQILRIGELAGTPDSAGASAAAFERRLTALRSRHAGASPVDVFYQVAARPLLTVNGQHIISDALSVCGGRNVFADLPSLTPAVSRESVIARRPQAIVTTWHPAAGQADASVEHTLEDWLRWTVIPAVADRQLFVIDADLLSRPTPRMLDGIDALCAYLERARQSTS